MVRTRCQKSVLCACGAYHAKPGTYLSCPQPTAPTTPPPPCSHLSPLDRPLSSLPTSNSFLALPYLSLSSLPALGHLSHRCKHLLTQSEVTLSSHNQGHRPGPHHLYPSHSPLLSSPLGHSAKGIKPKTHKHRQSDIARITRPVYHVTHPTRSTAPPQPRSPHCATSFNRDPLLDTNRPSLTHFPPTDRPTDTVVDHFSPVVFQLLGLTIARPLAPVATSTHRFIIAPRLAFEHQTTTSLRHSSSAQLGSQGE